MDLNNYSPEMLKVLLDTVKLRKMEVLIMDAEGTYLKELIKWEVELELAFNDAQFEKRQLPINA
jgi:hypothetical protein